MASSSQPPFQRNRAIGGAGPADQSALISLDQVDAEQFPHGIFGVALNNLGDVVVNMDFISGRPSMQLLARRSTQFLEAWVRTMTLAPRFGSKESMIGARWLLVSART